MSDTLPNDYTPALTALCALLPAAMQAVLQALPRRILLAALTAQADAADAAAWQQACPAEVLGALPGDTAALRETYGRPPFRATRRGRMACPTCGTEAYPCACLTGAADPLARDLDPEGLDDAPIPYEWVAVNGAADPPWWKLVPPVRHGATGARWPVLGMVCTCNAQAGVHVADAACMEGLTTPTQGKTDGP